MSTSRARRAPMQEMLPRRRVLTILGAAVGLPLLASADQPKHPTPLRQWRGTSLGCPSRILLHHSDGAAAERAVAQCVDEIERLEKAFGLYRSDSEIARLNRHGRLDAPSHDLLALLWQCQRLYDLSGGSFDVTTRRVALARPGMGLTLNGIAQGYLTDRIADILRANGCDRVLAPARFGIDVLTPAEAIRRIRT